jgi:pimeloyl-ACP methyl ester carboxylesterase
MEAGYVQAGPVRLQYFAHGRGAEVVVLVHGYQASGRVWGLVQEALDPQRFQTIALNNRGAGDSDRTAREDDYTIESFAADLDAAARALGLHAFTLVGHSLGAATVTHYALGHQENLKALALVSPVPLDHRTGPNPAATAEQQGSALAAAAAIERARAPQDFLRVLDADVARTPPERLAGGRASMGRTRLRERLAELSLPVLVVGGDQDPLVGVESILREYLALPAATRSLHVLHGAGHTPSIGAPGELAAVLERFVTQTVPAQGNPPGVPPSSGPAT